jgi:DNA-binding MarR family transcriptional regulator
VDHQINAPSIGEALTRASAITDQIFSEFVGDAYGLRRMEFVLLQVITRNPGINQKGLTEVVGVSAPHISLVLDRLLKRGLIDRQHSSNDGRQRCIQLTRLGHDLARQANRSLLRGEALALSALSPAERTFLGELLLRVAHARAEPDLKAPNAPFQGSPRPRSTLKFHPSDASPSLT